jgi:acyl carrier protein
MTRQEEATDRRLRDFIVTELLDEPFQGQDPLAAGVVDSLGIEQLVEYIQESFGIELSDEEITYDNFESLDALVALLDSRR